MFRMDHRGEVVLNFTQNMLFFIYLLLGYNE